MTKINPNKYISPLAVLLTNPGSYKNEQHAKAAKYVKEGLTLHIAENGVWSASKPNTQVCSYERIGYHSGAEWILEGWLLAGGKVKFHGFDGIHGEVSLA